MRKDIKIKKVQVNFKVNVWKYERGWGSKIDYSREFDTYEEAVNFINKFNSQNISPTVPDWYMVARPDNFEIKNGEVHTKDLSY